MSGSVTIAAVRAASIEAVRELKDARVTADGRAAAEAILSGERTCGTFHGVGIESNPSVD